MTPPAFTLLKVTRIADSEGKPCFLEASSEGSRKLYMRHGFQDVEVLKLGDGAPQVRAMSRPAMVRPAGRSL